MKYEVMEEYVDECQLDYLSNYGDKTNLKKCEKRMVFRNMEINEIPIMTGDESNVVLSRICG